MHLSSYSNVFGVTHARNHPEEIHAGDVVRAGQNHYPLFFVVAVSGDKAWLRNVETGADGITPLDRCRKVTSPSPQKQEPSVGADVELVD